MQVLCGYTSVHYSTSNTDCPRGDAQQSQRGGTLLTVLLWQPPLKQTLVGLCKCICARVFTHLRGCGYLDGSRDRVGREGGALGRWVLLLLARWEREPRGETLLAAHGATLAAGAVNGAHTLFSSPVEW